VGYTDYCMELILESLTSKWRDFDTTIALIIFVAYIIVDGAWAYYTIAVQERKALRAATLGSVMYFLLALGVLNYVHNYLYLVPLALGSWLGTYIVVKNNVRMESVPPKKQC